MAKKEHPALARVPVKELPKKLRDLYFEECNKSLPTSKLLNIDCTYGFGWNNSTQGTDFWHDVYEGIWDEEYDSEETLDEKLSNVFSLIKKIPR
jgi:hypothetical protein